MARSRSICAMGSMNHWWGIVFCCAESRAMARLLCAAVRRLMATRRRAMPMLAPWRQGQGRRHLRSPRPGPGRAWVAVLPSTPLAYPRSALHLGADPLEAQGLPDPVLPPLPYGQGRRRRRRSPPRPAARRGAPAAVIVFIAGGGWGGWAARAVAARAVGLPQLDVPLPAAAPATVHTLGVAHLVPEEAERAAAGRARLPHHLEGVLGHALDDAQLAQDIPEKQHCCAVRGNKR